MSSEFHGRVEDQRLITGQGRYCADWRVDGLHHAVFVRSDHAHADILAVDTVTARAMPGVVAVLTAADLTSAALGPFPVMGVFSGINGQSLLRTDRPVLAHDRVRHVGEAIAVVVAHSEAQARDAAEHVSVAYRERPVVVDAHSALAAGAAQLHVNIPNNCCYESESGDRAATDAAFARAHHVSRVTVDTGRVIGNPLEPRACMARYQVADQTYHLHVPSQGVIPMRRQIAGMLQVDESKVLVEARDVGGSFGIRSNAYPEYVVLAVAAKQLGVPIKWVATRSECFLTDTQGRGVVIDAELALDSAGIFLAKRFAFRINLGAYQSASGAMTATHNSVHCAVGVYRTPVVYGRITLIVSNVAPMAAYRGAGRPDIAYAIERVVDVAASEMGLDAVELRRRNLIPASAFPYKTPNAATYDSGNYRRGLELAVERADYAGFAARRARSLGAGKLRGIGVATFIEGTGAGAFPKDQADLRFAADGSITLHTVSQTQGQGHETAFPLIVSRVLGVDARQIKLIASEAATTLVGNHTGGSRSTVGAGSASFVAAQRALDLAKRYAAEELHTDMQGVTFTEGVFSHGDRQLSFAALMARLAEGLPTGEPHPLDMIGEGTFRSTYPNGAHIAEVEIDPATGVTTVPRYTAVDDCGNVIDHTLVEGQLVGGIAQGAGQVFGEQAIYDPASGQLMSGTFMDYPMPRAGWLGDLTIEDNGVASPTNPLGVKGVGESGTTGSIACLTNAVMNALSSLGVRQLDMPFTPARVWAAIDAAKARDLLKARA